VAAGITREKRFADRACLVTGGGRGIGRAIALALAEEGGDVGVVARTRSQCEAVAAEIGEHGLALQADVSDQVACECAVAEFAARFGPPSVLVNAAGISPVRQRAEAHDVEAFCRILQVNLVGVFTMTRAAAPALLASSGCVVNLGSVLGTMASPRLAGYGASKAGLIQLTRTLAREWAHAGVRVNAVCPGYVETDMTRTMLTVEHIHEDILAATPLHRLATIDEIVAPVLFLASEEASYITGVALLVDGGTAA
jgi:NAD(P)-dependent dehydrogenase (short-subunit alcohol dehydrogenase family)